MNKKQLTFDWLKNIMFPGKEELSEQERNTILDRMGMRVPSDWLMELIRMTSARQQGTPGGEQPQGMPAPNQPNRTLEDIFGDKTLMP